MKVMRLGLSLVLASGLAACTQIGTGISPIPRDQLAENIAPILDMEKRLDQVMYYNKMLVSLGGLSQSKSRELKKHLDVYYVYYLASNIQLARGNMESYQAHIELAKIELDTMESILKDGLDKDWGEFDSVPESELSQSKL